jgi:RNA-directed DNA polymerase
MASQINISKQRGSCADYNSNNSWYFNGTNGCFNNNNRYNGNFRSRPALDYGGYDNANLETYPIPLHEWLILSIMTAKGKHNKPSCVFFHLDRIHELIRLCHEVNLCEVMPREGTAHIIFEPRIREIVCAHFSSRVKQTFYITSLKAMLEQFYHPDSYSCRVGKGGLKGILQLQDYIFEASNGYTEDCWIAKVDLKAFFMSLDCFQTAEIFTNLINERMPDGDRKEILKYLTRIIYLAATKDHIKDMARPEERAMLEPIKSIYNQPYYRGVPIGDWGSQTAGLVITTFALFYLSSLGYTFIHYTDDTVVVVRDKQKWLEDVERLSLFYKNEFGLTLHPQKRYLQHYSKGVEALGYKLRFNRILPSDRIYHNLCWFIERTIRKADMNPNYVLTHKDKILATTNSYLGFLKWCNAYRLRKWVCEQIVNSAIGMVMEAAKDYSKVTIKPHYTQQHYYHVEFKELKKSLKLAA